MLAALRSRDQSVLDIHHFVVDAACVINTCKRRLQGSRVDVSWNERWLWHDDTLALSVDMQPLTTRLHLRGKRDCDVNARGGTHMRLSRVVGRGKSYTKVVVAPTFAIVLQ